VRPREPQKPKQQALKQDTKKPQKTQKMTASVSVNSPNEGALTEVACLFAL
jgi:hypothetical protein